ncbi:hypothetical protein [Agromyces bauzanensis]
MTATRLDPAVAAPPRTRPALIALLALFAVTTVHHLYGGLALDSPNRLLVPVLVALPVAAAVTALVIFRRTGRRAAVRTYATIALALAVLLGIVHSAYSHVYKDVVFLTGAPAELYVLLNPDEHFPPDDVFFELTGVVELGAAIAVAVTAIRLLRSSSGRRTGGGRSAAGALE